MGSKHEATKNAGKPGLNCPRCPRLVAFRERWRAEKPDWYNAPVPSFGPIDARVLIVGLAPGLQGANRTGRPFTGDWAGDLLYETLDEFGFSRGNALDWPKHAVSQPQRRKRAIRNGFSRVGRAADRFKQHISVLRINGPGPTGRS